MHEFLEYTISYPPLFSEHILMEQKHIFLQLIRFKTIV